MQLRQYSIYNILSIQHQSIEFTKPKRQYQYPLVGIKTNPYTKCIIFSSCSTAIVKLCVYF